MTLTELLTEKEYAEQRQVSRRTVQRERALGVGAPFIRLGRKIFYRPDAVDQWLISQEQTPVRSVLNKE